MLVAAQKVELIGNDTGWAQEWSPLILAMAAITAAVVAAYVAMRNHQQQLAHDRFLRNQDHIRDTIDGALVCASDARDKLDNFVATVSTIEKMRDEREDVPPSGEDMAREERDAALANFFTMRGAQVRLEARLGEHHSVAVSHKKALRSLHAVFMAALDGITKAREEEVREEDKKREKEAKEAFVAFRTACHAWFNESTA